MALTDCLVIFLIALATSALLTAAPTEETANESTYSPKAEEPCTRAGGICILESQCPAGRISSGRGLCPTQQSAGVECCHSLPLNEKRCAKRGGLCMLKTRCGRQLWDEHAKDCSQNEACCILVEK